jgi:hypothetical protein
MRAARAIDVSSRSPHVAIAAILPINSEPLRRVHPTPARPVCASTRRRPAWSASLWDVPLFESLIVCAAGDRFPKPGVISAPGH